MIIYLVYANVDYESSTVVRAYKGKKKAEKFAKKCERYEQTQELSPDTDDDKAFDAWSEREAKWIAGHPAGHHYWSDSFTVAETELY